MINTQKRYAFIGGKIREAREAAGFLQKGLADKIGDESATAISYLESGERKVSVVDLEKIAHLLDRDIRFFIGQEGERLNVRVALRAETGLDSKDQNAILHIIEMAKKRTKDNGTAK